MKVYSTDTAMAHVHKFHCDKGHQIGLVNLCVGPFSWHATTAQSLKKCYVVVSFEVQHCCKQQESQFSALISLKTILETHWEVNTGDVAETPEKRNLLECHLNTSVQKLVLMA